MDGTQQALSRGGLANAWFRAYKGMTRTQALARAEAAIFNCRATMIYLGHLRASVTPAGYNVRALNRAVSMALSVHQQIRNQLMRSGGKQIPLTEGRKIKGGGRE